MKSRYSSCCGILTLAVFLPQAALAALTARPVPRPAPPTLLEQQKIRVRIAEGQSQVRLRGFDLSFYEGSGVRLVGASDKTSEWEFRCGKGTIYARPLSGSGKPLKIASPALVQSKTGFAQISNRPYREKLRIHAIGSSCDVVNELDLEKYLDGLVNAEFSASWSQEAIAAQVVAARTYAFHEMQHAKGRHYDLESTTRDQVYDGPAREDFRASRTIERTRGVVLVTGKEPIKAFYHSTCGGKTELPQHVWGKPFSGFTRTVRCPFCISSPAYHWDLDLNSGDVAKTIRKGVEGDGRARLAWLTRWPKSWKAILDKEQLADVRISKKDSEGRVREVLTLWGHPSVPLPIPAIRFRNWFGAAQFRSTSFIVGKKLSGWKFEGQGNGHGVGLCQYGAKAMGERGFQMADILKFYYPDANLKKLW